MAAPSRTNSPYAHLAYQAAIRDALIELLMERYVGNELAPPEVEIECTCLTRADSIVPSDEILSFVEELKANKTVIEGALSQYDFVRKDDAQQGLSFNPSHAGVLQPKRGNEPAATQSSRKKGTKRRRAGGST